MVTSWRETYRKPVVLDEICYEGDIQHGWGNISAQELVRRFWEAAVLTGASIGLHTHSGNCEIVYVLSGSGQCIDDGAEYPISAGVCHYCPEGHTHSIRNTGGEPLELLGVLPVVK